MMVESADELKDIGIQLITARLLFSKLQGWKANGVDRSLLVPAPAGATAPPPFTFSPPPPPTSPRPQNLSSLSALLV